MALNKPMVAVFLAAVVVLTAAEASAAITCGQVGTSLAPCISYVTGKSALSPGCCNGVRSLKNMAKTSADRQAACKCLKNLAGTIKSLNLGTVAQVPGMCRVNVPFPISMSTDCNKVT